MAEIPYKKIPFLRELITVNNGDEENIQSVVPLENFLQILRIQHEEKDKQIRSFNIVRELEAKPDGIINIDNRKFVTVNKVLQFVFNNKDNFGCCASAADAIQTHLYGGIPESIWRIYSQVANNFFKTETCELLNCIEIPEAPTLHGEYKEHFCETDWKKICLFEYHFHKEYESGVSHLEEITLRAQFLKSCSDVKLLSESMYNQCRKLIKSRLKRQAAHELEDGVLLSTPMFHSPMILEVDILNYLAEYTKDIVDVVVVDCVPSICKHGKGLHIFAERNGHHVDAERATDLSVLIGRSIRDHSVTIHEISYLAPKTLEPYSEGQSKQRFKLRDDFYLCKLKESVDYVSSLTSQTEALETDGKCHACFGTNVYPALSLHNFDILTEWHLDVPIISQVLLETFINKGTLRKSDNKISTTKPKLLKLYSIHDSLLNIINRNYSGILQKMNTTELSMNYHSVRTVFSVTNSSGATLSLSSAEKDLKQKSDSDRCYFNTFLKKHQIQYESIGGKEDKCLSLRDCHQILYLDNLVRLTFRDVPNRSESRSAQVCTLPMTVKGLPLDAAITQNWHDPSICNGGTVCPCKASTQLSPQDLDPTLISLTEQERCEADRFRKLCIWGHPQIWAALTANKSTKQLIENAVSFNNSTEMDESPSVANDSNPLISFPGPDDGCITGIENSTESEDLNQSFNLLTLNSSPNQPTEDRDEENQGMEYFSSPCHAKNIQEENTCDGRQIEVDEQPDLEAMLMETDIEQYNLPGEFSFHERNITAPFDLSGIQPLSDTPDRQSASSDQVKLTQTKDLGFVQYHPPPLLCRHPPPAIGRDDNISKLKEILDEFLIKAGHFSPGPASTTKLMNRILFAPDNKVANNLFKLMDQNAKYRAFLPEFPLLHLRKSKITTLMSGYKNAGLLHLIKYMRDSEDEEDWTKLISASNIDTATKYVKRVNLAICVALVVKFLEILPSDESTTLLTDLQTGNILDLVEKWDCRFQKFVHEGQKANATFALHMDLLKHCEEVTAIWFSERLGGPSGYHLLLASVKSSLPFSFLNGASSYAAFCTRLLFEHYSAGFFHQQLKMALYTTPHKGSKGNLGLDTQREMDHRDALKGFRPGATVKSVLPRMSLVDTFCMIREQRMKHINDTDVHYQSKDTGGVQDNLKFGQLSQTDIEHILPVVSIIIRRDGLNIKSDPVPKNVYTRIPSALPPTILDKLTYDAGVFLIHRYVQKEGLFGEVMCKSADTVNCPRPLLAKLKTGKSVTVRRAIITMKENDTGVPERDIKEKKRKALVARKKKEVDCLVSQMNLCQALVKPDCSKPKVAKAQMIQKALTSLLDKIVGPNNQNVSKDEVFLVHTKQIPQTMSDSVKIVTMEFAGVKFKSKAGSGDEYLQHVQNGILKRTLGTYKCASKIVVCEEKYQFTPDDFKAATRSQRVAKKKNSIAHLKSGEEILSLDNYATASIVTTSEGKTLISKFLAENVSSLNVGKSVELYIDSELYMRGCTCEAEPGVGCTCQLYTVPVKATFQSNGLEKVEEINTVHQRKGEAEMSQADRLPDLQAGDSIASIVTSGDIDGVIIHMFLVSHKWPRDDNGKFIHQVYVVLQKPMGYLDMYCITKMVEILEEHYMDTQIGLKVAMTLCLGGNDFLPKFHGQSHSKILSAVLENERFLSSLFVFNNADNTGHINVSVFLDMLKVLYLPCTFDHNRMSFEEVRQFTIRRPVKPANKEGEIRNPQTWLPPEDVILHVAKLVDCQIEYLFTAGNHESKLPDFFAKGCLVKNLSGEVEYYFGEHTHTDNIKDTLWSNEKLWDKMQEVKIRKAASQKRQLEITPQKGARRKSGKWLPKATSTPNKFN